MLELPESHTLARQLRETVGGKRVEDMVAGSTPHGFAWYHGDPSLYGDSSRGRLVDEVNAFGGWVELYLEDMRLNLYDGLNIRYYPPEAGPPQKHQLLIRFEGGACLACTVQMYGGMALFPTGEYDNIYYTTAREKPSPLTGEFDESYFEQMLAQAKQTMSAKAFLATEQRIPGLGNGVLQDILFQARIHPKTKLRALTDLGRESLFHSVKSVLAEMTAAGGRDTEKDLFGNNGGYRTILSKNTVKSPCPVCGDSIVRQAYLGGNVYFCPSCQPLVS